MHKKIGVLALQGAVSEHIAQLQGLGALGIEIKTAEDLKLVKGLIIPGGESTAISRLIQEVGLYEPIRDFARKNPVFGTCAGLILCGSSITDGGEKLKPLNLIDIAVTRNGFGFIRAPYIASVGEDVNVLAEYDKKIVMAEQGNILVCSFHPELTENNQVMDYFMSKIES